MPRRSVDGWTLASAGLPGESPIYSSEIIDDIIARAGGLPAPDRQEELAERLESAARQYLRARWLELAPTACQLAERFERIEGAAAALLRELGTPNGDVDQMPDALRFGGLQAHAAAEAISSAAVLTGAAEDLLRDSLAGVIRLRAWAGEAATLSRAEQAALKEQGAREANQAGKRRPSRNAGDPALGIWIDNLSWLWLDLFDKEPGRSVYQRGSDKAAVHDGPFIRFVEDCLRPALGKDSPTKKQISDRVKRDRIRRILRNMAKSAAKNT